MEKLYADWPGKRWSLTAPESYVLNYVGEGVGKETLKLAIKELVARSALRVESIEARGLLGAGKAIGALTAGPRAGAIDEPTLVPLLSVFDEAEKRSLQATAASAGGMRAVHGVPVRDFASEAHRRFKSFNGYRDRCVLPGLVERGLMRIERRTLMGLVLGERKSWTAAGRAAVDELDRWLRVGGEGLGDWVSSDPAKVLAYRSGAGAALLLLGNDNRAIALLDQQLRRRHETGADDASDLPIVVPDDDDWPTDSVLETAEADGIDLGAMDLDLGGLGGLDAAFGAIDSGVDAATYPDGFTGGGS